MDQLKEDPFKEAGKDPFAEVADDPFGNTETTEKASDDPWGDQAETAPWEVAASEDKFTFGGRIWNKFAADTQEDNAFEDLYQNHVQVQLDGTYRPSSAVEIKVGVGGDYYAYGQDSDWDDDGNVRVFDAYLNLTGKGFNLKAGNQIVRWGKADGFSPLDNLNPEDFRDGVGGRREDRKMQIPMVNLEVYPAIFTLQGVYLPFFVESKYNIRDTDWALLDHYEQQVGVVGVVEEDLTNSLDNGEAGLRLSGVVGRLDYAISYFYTHEDVGSLDSLVVPPGFTPVFSSRVIRDMVEFTHQTGQEIRLRHDRQHIYGAEFETTLSSFGLRGDVAYTNEVSFTTEQFQRVRKPVFQYIVGADYNGPGAFYFNLQFGQEFINDYDDDIVLNNELSSNLNGTISKGFFNEDFTLEFRWFYDLNGDGTLYNPKLIVEYWQNIGIELGVEIFGGTDMHPLGIYRDNDQVYFFLEWYF